MNEFKTGINTLSLHLVTLLGISYDERLLNGTMNLFHAEYLYKNNSGIKKKLKYSR